jgi:8-oxo-dGTP pyrophosphatase MutT (NUDIX family)
MAGPTHGGGVVFRLGDSGPLYLLVEASSSKGRWVFPKGGIGRRESAEEAAVREVAEEAAVQARPVQALGRVRLAKGGGRIHVEFFLMEYVRDAEPLESRDVRWCRFETGLEALDDAEAIELLQRANELVTAAHRTPRPGRAAVRALREAVATAPLGVPAILVAALPFAPELALLPRSSPGVAVAVAGAAILSAHPLGILLARLAETLLAPAARHLRLRLGLETKRGGLELEDFFEADAMRFRLHPRDAETARRLRSWARAAAVLTVLLPGVTAAGIQLGARLRGEGWWPALIPVAYAAAAAGTLGVLRWGSAAGCGDTRAVRAYASRRGLLRGKRSKGESARRLAADLAEAPLVWAALGLLAFSFALPISFESRTGAPAFEWVWVAVAAAGSVLAVLSAWAWWRVTRRHDLLLLDSPAR